MKVELYTACTIMSMHIARSLTHSLKVPAHNKPSAVEIEREGESVQREYGRDGVDKVLAPG